MANKLGVAKEIFSRAQIMVENLPKWLQQGIVTWNKTSFELENGSKLFCAATSPSAVRGFSINCLLADEFGILSNTLADEFIASVFPTLSSSNESKLFITSTPKGFNAFHKIWSEAESGINNFVPVRGYYYETPGRDEKWLDEQAKLLGGKDSPRFKAEVLCSFMGSSNTLFDSDKLSAIPIANPISKTNNLKIYENPINGHSYVSLVDVARGGGGDYSVSTIIDISEMPYKVVAIYRDNTVSTLVFPEVIMKLSKIYNNAFTLIETNDLGQQVADILYYDLEYENVYMSSKDNIAEGGKSYSPGLRTTTKTKAIGCDTLKTLVENDQLILNDSELLSEASNFIRVGKSYKADDGKTDDIMMTLVIFAYLTTQQVFKDLFDFDLRSKLIEAQMKDLEDSMLPVGFHSNDYYSDMDAGWENYGSGGIFGY